MPIDVDAICFDLDDTLCVYERTVEDVLALSFDRTGVEPFFDGPTYRSYFDQFLEDFDDADELRAHCFAEIASDRGRDRELGRAVAAEYAAARDPANVRPRAGAPDVVRQLAGEYPLAPITKGDATMQADKLDRIGLADAFDDVVFAGDDTAPKPEAEPFEHALASLDASAERTVHVGNSLDSDVAGARGAGLLSAWTPAAHDLPRTSRIPARFAPITPRSIRRPTTYSTASGRCRNRSGWTTEPGSGGFRHYASSGSKTSSMWQSKCSARAKASSREGS